MKGKNPGNFLPARKSGDMSYEHMNKTTAILCCLIASLLAFVPISMGEPFVDAKTNLQVTAPDDWTSAPDGENLLITSPDSLATITLMSFDAGDVTAAMSGMTDELAKILTDIVMDDETREHDLNGLPAVSARGTALHTGTPVSFAFAVVDAGDHCLIVLAFGTEEGMEKHSAEIDTIFDSIKMND